MANISSEIFILEHFLISFLGVAAMKVSHSMYLLFNKLYISQKNDTKALLLHQFLHFFGRKKNCKDVQILAQPPQTRCAQLVNPRIGKKGSFDVHGY